jgi:hypothetical protein
MSTPQIERLRTHCHRLRHYKLEAELSTLLEQAANKDVSYSDFLDELLALEVRSKTEKHLGEKFEPFLQPVFRTGFAEGGQQADRGHEQCS